METVVPLDNTVHVVPPFIVFNIRPLLNWKPAINPVLASIKFTDSKLYENPMDTEVQVDPPFKVFKKVLIFSFSAFIPVLKIS